MNPYDPYTGSEYKRAKRNHYKTARACISCALFREGDFVAVEYFGARNPGTHWFKVAKSREALESDETSTHYPEHHLTDFVL